MIPEADPQVIFYLGPAGETKTRQALRTVAANPRSLIVTLDEDPYTFRNYFGNSLNCSCYERTTALHGAGHVRIAGRSNWQKEVFSARVYDRVFFKDLPEYFRKDESALGLARSLSRLAVMRSADVVVALDFLKTETIIAWEGSLPFSWGGHDQSLGFWINAHGAPLRYLRMPALKLLQPQLSPIPAHASFRLPW